MTNTMVGQHYAILGDAIIDITNNFNTECYRNRKQTLVGELNRYMSV